MPFAPELGGRSRGGIAAEAVADGQKQGTIDVEAADAVVFLVAQVLRNGLFLGTFDVGTLAFDDDQWDAVHKEHNIRAVGVAGAGAGDGKLFGDVIDVVLGLLPVDVAHGVALLVAVDALLEGLAEGEHVIHGLVAVEVAAFHGHVAHGDDAILDVLLREARLTVATDADGVQCPQLTSQHLFQQHVGGLSAAQFQRLFWREVLVAQLLQQFQCRFLADIVFFEGDETHDTTCLNNYFVTFCDQDE